MAVPYLQVDNLTKSFGDLVLFENISFGIAEGQRVGLIAKNGSGKTTLLNIIAGKEGYDSGNIVFRRDLRVDYLEQDPQYPEELTVLEACFHHGNSTVELIKEYERCMETEGHPGLEDLLARMDQEKAWEYEQKAKQILSQLKIRNFDQQVKQLSGGQQQRVGVARALAANPEVLLMDEPFGALDPVTREALQQEMIRIHRLLGRTIVLVTHDIDEALRLADHLVLMDGGEVVQQGEPLQMLLEPKNAFVETFFGRSELGVRLLSLRGVSDYLRRDERLAGDVLNVTMTLREALSQFVAHRREVLPVVDEQGEACGTLHFADLLREEARREGAA